MGLIGDLFKLVFDTPTEATQREFQSIPSLLGQSTVRTDPRAGLRSIQQRVFTEEIANNLREYVLTLLRVYVELSPTTISGSSVQDLVEALLADVCGPLVAVSYHKMLTEGGCAAYLRAFEQLNYDDRAMIEQCFAEYKQLERSGKPNHIRHLIERVDRRSVVFGAKADDVKAVIWMISMFSIHIGSYLACEALGFPES